ncbi:MAG: nicotinate-nucleotide--dimethylbenzimidazole phosphoribosyltransferase [Prevotella sp.]|nr:nicotinate-nucleotide--dimethylbenzimidazole phosphoribosyltransferase [Prevotella sp.]
MRAFKIEPLERDFETAIQQKIDNLNKPKGSLGRLEELAMQICLMQQTLEPRLSHPCHLLLGGDHGIEREGVSATPRCVTWQQMVNFTRGGGGVNMFCRQHGFKLRIVDVGVDYDLASIVLSSPRREKSCSVLTSSQREVEALFLDRKIARGTRNFLYEPAMSEEELEQTIEVGVALADDCHREGCNILCIGEMGAANTSPSSIWMSLFCGIPLSECIGAGSGLDGRGISHKQRVLEEAVKRFLSSEETTTAATRPSLKTAETIRYFGGFEMVAAIGAMLRAAELRMLVMVDGFIMTACALAACQLYPEAKEYMIFGHCGDESGHRRMLDFLQAKPLLSLGLRLGEGTGALCAYPIIDSAVRMINEMNNFRNANITKYF